MREDRPDAGKRAGKAATQDPTSDRLAALMASVTSTKRPPIHLWNPEFCGDIDMRIASDGVWFYNGTPIGRLPLVKLFASILRREEERYVLVTPVEKVGIRVDDVPFLAVEMAVDGSGNGQTLHFRTNLDDMAVAGREHPLRFEPDVAGGVKPYILVRDNLWARLTRPLLYDLVAIGESNYVEGQEMFGIRSGGLFFPIAPMKDLEAWT